MVIKSFRHQTKTWQSCEGNAKQVGPHTPNKCPRKNT